jgi:hypothetical protein
MIPLFDYGMVCGISLRGNMLREILAYFSFFFLAILTYSIIGKVVTIRKGECYEIG